MKLELSKTNRQNIEDIYPLSPMQEGMLFESLYAPESEAYFEQITCILTGNLDLKTFEQAWQQVVARHPVFRTAFLWESLSQPVQVVYRQINVTVDTYDWRELSAQEQQQQLETFLDYERQKGFQLSLAPLMRLHLIQLDRNTYQFVWCHHHLLLDGWSSPLIFKDLLEFYQAISQGRGLSNIPTLDYRNYIAWLQQQDRDLAKKFWRQKLQGFTTPTPLTVDKPLLMREQRLGYGEQQINLTVSATAEVMSFVRQHQLTMSNLVQATWGLLLSRYSQETDVVFGATVSGRPPELVGVESIVGLFINTLPVRVQISEKTELLGLLKDLQTQQVESEQFSYSPLAEIQGLSDVPRGTSLFESIVVFENYPVDTAVLEGNSDFSLSNFRWIEQTNYPLTVVVAPGKQLSLRVMYDASRFEDRAISRMLGHFATMLEAIVANPVQRISQLPMLTEFEQQQLLVDWNDTQVDYPRDKCIHQLFQEQAELTPNDVAVVYENQYLTYRELNSRANQLAHYLKSLGVGADVLVGICVERSLEMVVGLLGILKAGGAYVPLNPEYPQERLTFMLEDTHLSVILTQEQLVNKLDASLQRSFAERKASVICLDSNWDIINQQTQQNPTSRVKAQDLAYVMYTSGSTGQPKGVSIIHRSVVRLVKETNYISISARDVIAQASNYAFDAATFEIWGALLNGARLVGVSKDLALSPKDFATFLRSQSISVLFLTTALFNQIAQEVPSAFNSLQYLLFGGEAVDPKWVKEVLNSGAPQQLLHVYGPTENTTFSSWYLVQDVPEGATTIPIGQPISNTQIYLLDPQLQLVGIGVPGELYVGGDGLAREYLNRSELTQEKFIPNPFEQAGQSKLYKTGDLARYLSDGNIEYLARTDNQVKIRGLRIELGEIEAVLSQHREVQGSCVIVREDIPGDKRLVAYIVTYQNCQPTIGEIRQFLKAKLPDYMIPNAIVLLESFPLTPNGKVDHRALPKPDLDTTLLEKYVAPRTPIEEILVLLWTQVLKVQQVGIYDNFFELGGHSLLATQLVSRIRTSFKVELPLRELFAAPTIAQLAPLIQQLQQRDLELAAPPILKRAENAELSLSFAQQRLWFLDQFEPNSPFYNIPFGLRFVGSVNVAVLKQSLTEIIYRHEALRTNFVSIDGKPTQIIQIEPNWSPTVVDLQHLPVTEQEIAAQQLVQQQAIEPFDLANDALIRATLVVLSPNEQWLSVCMHHVVSDGWSIGVFIEELQALYNAYSIGQPSPLLPLPIQYADFAIWQRQWLKGEVLKSQLSYWKQQLADAPTFLPLPTDRPRPAVQTFNGAHLEFSLSAELTQKLVKLSQQQGCTLFMTLLAAYNTLLYRYTGQEDILVGTPIANRDRTETERLIGFFVNTLVMRADLSVNPSFRELLSRTREMALSAYAHQDLPFEMLVEALQPERDPSHTPLFQVMFVLNNAPISEIELTGLSVRSLPIESSTAKFDLTLSMENTTSGLFGGWDYNSDLFSCSTIERMTGHFVTLLEAIVANPNERISHLPILTAFEQQQLLIEWNDTAVDYPFDKCIHQLFEDQVERTPDAIAVVFENQQLTYHELNCRANQLAHYLRSLGVGADVLVGICVERSLEMVVGLLGTLKAGGAYVPLDPEYPQDRLSFMLADAQVSVLLTQQHLVKKLPEHQARVVCLDTDWQIIPQSNQQNPIAGVQASNSAYVIYTSGSTGKPKGAINTHLGVCNRLLWMQQAYQLTEIDCVLQKTPFSFDVSVWEFFWPLLTGARLVVAKPGGHRDSGYLVNLILEQQVTTLHFVPSMLQIFLEELRLKDCSSLKRVICSGEALPKELQERFFACLRCQLYNLYGPTEAAIDVTYWECQPESNLKTVPIGRPISNTQIYILDQNLQPVPVGVPGELHIGGAGLAKGYLNRNELTQEKFIPNPFDKSKVKGQKSKLYKTGDLARYLSDGNIDYLGRIDNQVKIRGFRIELGEIEAALSQHPHVQALCVIAREDTRGDKHLVSYIVLQPEQTTAVKELRSFLKEKLPEYMVPSAIVILESLPLTPNGKIDRRALPAPELSSKLSDKYVAPRTPLEEILALTWQEVLKVELVGRYDNFFELGGHSLLATQLVSRIRTSLKVELPLRELFAAPTIAQLAPLIQQLQQQDLELAAPPILKRANNVDLPLSYAQQRLWFLDQLEPNSSFYNIPIGLRLVGSVNIAVLEKSLIEIIHRHEALRTNFVSIDGKQTQIIQQQTNWTVAVVDLQHLPWGEQEIAAEKLLQQQAIEPFDLAEQALIRATLVILSPTQQWLLVCMHHVVSDAWSIGVFVQELQTLYNAYSISQPSPLLPLPIQYADFAIWQKQWLVGEVLKSQLSYWKQQLANAPTFLPLPTDRPRPAVQTFNGAYQKFALSVELTQQLTKLSQNQGCTLSMTLLAAYNTLLYRYTGQEDILVGTPITNRDRTEIEGLIGFFVNTLVMRADLSLNPSFNELLLRIRETALSAYAHQDLPLDMLVEALQPERDLSHTPLFQVMFDLNNAPITEIELNGLSVSELPIEISTVKVDLTLSMENNPSGLVGWWQYNTDLFDSSTIERMTGHFVTLLESIVANPNERISQLLMLTAFEHQQLLLEWNDTGVDYAFDKCLHQLFEEQVERTPDAVAVVYENQYLTYRQLNNRANSLAHYLRSLGVGADVLVGLCVERSLEMVVGLLSILKAGGAYVPLDPNYPSDRLSFMLEDAQVKVLLTQQQLIEFLPQHQARVICLDTDWEKIAIESESNLENTAKPDNLTYVIYTSGSTGKPKGVLVNHSNVVRLFAATNSWYNFNTQDVWTLFHSYAFDFSVWEIWGALLYGGRLVVVPYLVTRDPESFHKLLCQEKVTVLNQTPSAFRQLIQAEQSMATVNGLKLRLVIFGGEALEPKSLQPWFERHGDQLPQLVNMYGITETTVHVTYRPLSKADLHGTASVIGRPIPDLQVYVLDEHQQLVPIGVGGEMYVGGAGVARGYLNRLDLTQQRFISHPFSKNPQARLYKTGDLARYLPNGELEYLGRIDQQVKIRGFRIELGEIEAALTEHLAVGEAIVIAREDNPGNKRLVAYIVPDQKYAFPILQLLRFQNKSLSDEGLLYKLPNGMMIAHLNKNETEFVYKELWEEQTYLKHGITINEGDCIFDVGANIGLFTLFVGQICKDVSIYAFEPIPPVFELLRTNAENYSLNAKLFNLGLSSETKSDTFTYYPQVSVISGRFADTAQEREVIKSFLLKQQNIVENETEISSQAIDELLAERLQSQQFTCQLRTISDVMREHGVEKIDLLKIDVEKSEQDVLSGIQQEDWQKIKQIVVEVHNINGRLEEITALLKKHGYDLIIEQDALLEDTVLYNIYARRPSINQYLLEEPDSELVSNCVKPTWINVSLLLSEVRCFLQNKLPEYMVPNAFVLLESLPLTANGKVDRHALKAPDLQSQLSDKYVAPRNPIEEILSLIWAQVLKVELVGIHDNFFELGGHSLLATQLVSRVRSNLKVELPLRSLFAAPTIAQLAPNIQRLQQQDLELAAPPILKRAENVELPLSYAQQRLWFLAQFDLNSASYNIPVGLRLVGTVNVVALEQSLIEIIHRHEALRTNFITVDGKPSQIIQTQPNWSVAIVDLQHLPTSEQEITAQKLVQQQAIEPFDLANDALIRATLVVLSPTEQWLLMCMHHVVSDGWSMSVFVQELQALYNAYSIGQPSPLLPLPIQYADFALWQRQWLQGEVLKSQLNYWKEQLANAPTFLPLPTDRSRPAVQTFNGAHLEFSLSAELTQKLEKLSHEQGCTLFMTLLAAYNTLLYRYTGQEDILVGTPIANRDRSEIEGLIGFFVNTLVMRTNLAENPRFNELLPCIREMALSAYAHQDLPFEMLVEVLEPERDLSHTPLFQVMFVLQNTPASQLGLTGLSVSELPIETSTVKFDLTLVMENTSNGLFGWWQYNSDLFDSNTIERMSGHFVTLLEGIVGNPNERISHLPMLTAYEQQQLLVEWNDTQVDYPQDKCIHRLFEEQCLSTPDAVAVVLDNEQLTYRELNCRANQLAHYLRSLGVGADVLVGICAERSLEMVVGLLGILKAGGAYVPLDPEYPQDRLSFILEDAQVPVLLTQKHLVEKLQKHQAQVVCLDTDWHFISQLNQDNLITEAQATNLVYVIYTSGSTGTPKGVLIAHKGLLNLVLWHQRTFKITSSDKATQLAGTGFDAAAWELWPYLTAGASIHLVKSEILASPVNLRDWLISHQITISFVPTPITQELLSLEWTTESLALRYVLTGGDKLNQHPPASVPFQVVNNYGPTENTIVTTSGLVVPKKQDQTSPSIGRPISNTYIYILDKYLQPVPIGVPGELHIVGAGLARGYLNRSKLTQEKFIPNPFAGSTGAGERLYKTGDLTRYLPDGNIEYLGRIDNQIKIRGFRIELGEIEAILSQHPGVRENVVVAREDIPGEKRLVAYFVPQFEQTPTTNELRIFLKEKLPQYMVPSAFVRLECLPLTPNGKVDRKALPVPDSHNTQSAVSFVAPRTPVEKVLADIWANVLHLKQVGVLDNFFELGGHSLSTIRVMSLINETFQIKLPLRYLFTAPTITELAQTIESTSRTDSTVNANEITSLNLQAEVVLDETIKPLNLVYQPISEPKAILLTGATGFVGAFLLAELLQQTQADIYCLVRAANLNTGKQRLQETLKAYLLWEEAFSDRIVPVLGDLAQPLLGLGDEEFHLMALKIDIIYHNGALVNHVYPYALLKAANVCGTEEVLRLASQIKIKPVHFVSTISVFSSDEYLKLEVVQENDPLEHSQGLLGGYTQSKWVAEKIVMMARDRGLPCSIYRLGRITWHSQTGVWNLNDMFYRLIKACIQLKSAPEMNSMLEITPVDYLAKTLICLSQQPESLGKAFHLMNSHSAPWSQFIKCIRSFGYPLEQLSYEDWQAELLRNTQISSDNALYSAISLAEDNTSSQSRANAASSLKFDCQNTLNGLVDTGICWPEVDDKLLQAFFANFSKAG